MLINPALTRFDNTPDPGDTDDDPTASPASSNRGSIDLEHFAAGNAFGGSLPTMPTDPTGAASDRNDCIEACGIGGATVGAVAGGIASSLPGAAEGAAEGWTYGSLAGHLFCTEPDNTPAVDPAAAGGASGVDDGQDGAGGATGLGADPSVPPGADTDNAIGGYETPSGALVQDPGNVAPVSTDPGTNTPAVDTSGGSSSSGDTSSTDSTSSSSSSDSSSSTSSDDGRVGGSSGEGDLPADDSYSFGVNPRVADFGTSSVERALQASLLTTELNSSSNVAATSVLAVGLRA